MQTIFNDPQGWARSMIGTRKRYRLMQLQFFVHAFSVIINAITMAQASDRFQWWMSFTIMNLFLLVGMLLFPLSILRALRSFMPYEQDGRGFEVKFSDQRERTE